MAGARNYCPVKSVTVSSDLIEALVERGMALLFLSGRGQPVAPLSAPGFCGTVQTRRSQLAAYTSPPGVQLAIEFIRPISAQIIPFGIQSGKSTCGRLMVTLRKAFAVISHRS